MKSKYLVSALLTSLLLVTSCQTAPVNAPKIDSPPRLTPAQAEAPLILPPEGEQAAGSLDFVRNYASSSDSSEPTGAFAGAFQAKNHTGNPECKLENTTFVGTLPQGCNVTIVVTENDIPILTLVNPPPGSYPVDHGCGCGDFHIRAVATLSGTCSGTRVLSDYVKTVECVPTPTPVPSWEPGEVCKSGVCDNFTEQDIHDLQQTTRELARKYEQLTGDSTPFNTLSLAEGDFNVKFGPGDLTNLRGVSQSLDKLRFALETNIRLAQEKMADYSAQQQQAAQDVAVYEAQKEAIKKSTHMTLPRKGEEMAKVSNNLNDARERLSEATGNLERESSKAATFEDMLRIAESNEQVADTINNCVLGNCFPQNGSGDGPNDPDAPGCFRKLTGSQPIDVIAKDGTVAKSYTTAQGRSYEGHGTTDQPDPMTIYQDGNVFGDLNANCHKPDVPYTSTRTNIEWMRAGYAPCDASGHADRRGKGEVVQLHHFNQNPNGPLVEMSTAMHQQVSHPNKVSQIERESFSKLVARYWKLRAKQMTQGENAVACPPQ